MIPKDRKVKRSIFPSFSIKGKIIHSNNLILRVYSKDITLNNKTKFCFIVSKKVSKKAIERNLLKRRSYSIINNVLDDIKPGFICIFLLKKKSSNITFNDLQVEIIFLLKEANIL